MHHCGHHNYDNYVNRAFLLAILLNIGFVVTETICSFRANSTALLADAGHNFGDIISLLIAWGANYLLSVPSSKRYSYGFKKASILASLINALLLNITSVLIAVEAYHKLFHLTPINAREVIMVALLGVAINIGTASLFWRNAKTDLNIKAAFLHLLADAALAGGVVITASIIHYTAWWWLDPMVSIMIVGIILYSTFSLLTATVKMLLDAMPANINDDTIKAYLSSLPGVIGVHDLHIWHLSTKETALTVHLVAPGCTLADLYAHDLIKHLRHTFAIQHVTIQIEHNDDYLLCNHCQNYTTAIAHDNHH